MSLLLPAYLLGLAGLALPWLLHRFSRTRPEELVFPSTRFLEATTPPVSRRRELRYRWLLLLRVLLLVALCLLFAEPLWRLAHAPFSAERLRLIIVDQSFSMQLDGRLERARVAALEAIDSRTAGETLQVFGFGGALVPLSEPTTDPALARASLNRIEPGFARGDYGEMMQRLDVIAASAEQPVDAIVITDTQASALPARLGSLVAGQLGSLRIVDVSDAKDANQFLRAHANVIDSVHAGVTVDVGATAVEGSDTAVERELIVQHGNTELARESVLLQAGTQQTVVFDRLILPDEPVTSLSVGFRQRDDLPADDVAEVVLSGRDPIDVVVSNRLDRSESPSAVFAATALSTDEGLRVLDTAATGSLPDGARHAVVIADTQDLPPDIQRFVVRGGNVLLVQASTDELPAIPAAAPVDIDAAHPLALGEIDWYPVRYFRAGSLHVKTGDRVLMRTADGSPLLLERAVVQDNPVAGRLLVLGDPLDGHVSDLPLQPAFVDFVQAVIDWFVSSSALPARVTAGSRVHLPAGAQIIDGSGDALRGITQTGEAADVMLAAPGIYSVVGEQVNQRIEVYIDPAESLIEPLPTVELQAWEQRHDPVQQAEMAASTASADGKTDTATVEAADFPLWRAILFVLVLLATGESLWANRRLDIRRDGS